MFTNFACAVGIVTVIDIGVAIDNHVSWSHY